MFIRKIIVLGIVFFYFFEQTALGINLCPFEVFEFSFAFFIFALG